MIYVKIGSEERRIEDAHPQWITRTIQGERDAGRSVCVQVRFDIPGIQLILSTPGCSGGFGRARETFNPDERRLIDLWKELGLFDDPNFPPGKVVAFVQQVSHKFGVFA